jgi:hypothetical protein
MRFGRLSGLVLVLFLGCGGASPAPPTAPPPASNALAKEPVEKADLSPVAAPEELFVVGRLARPGLVVDTLGKWTGLPSLRGFLAKELAGLDQTIAWDAPVELAIALPKSGRRRGVRSVVSLGVTSTSEALNAVRDRGLSPERFSPEVFAFSGPGGRRCAVGPALGRAPARLVCGEGSADLEELFAYATRGLPNEPIGSRDLEVELRVEPLRRRFSSEIAGARLFAGFLVRQIELDSPRFDRALADAAYGLTDELVAEVEDTDSLRLGGSLDEANKNFSLDVAWKFRSSRSFVAGWVNDVARRPGPPPPAFARLPADSTAAGYTVDTGGERWAPVRASIAELIDAYLEHEKVGKKAREHATRLTKFLALSSAMVTSKGKLPPGKGTDLAQTIGWRLIRVELPIAEADRMVDDFHGIVTDRDLYKAMSKRFDLDPKAQPKSELSRLTGKGVPAGSRALTVTIPTALNEGIRKSANPRRKAEAKDPIKFALVTAPDGKGATVVVVADDKKDATERLLAFLGEGGERIGARKDLASFQAMRALHGEVFTLIGILDTFLESTEKAWAVMPNHGESFIVETVTATPGPPLVFSFGWTIPAGAFADLPGLVSSVPPF